MTKKATKSTEPALYHGGDKISAIKRAKSIGGCVLWSWAPKNASPAWGYWSDPSDCPMLRNGEHIEWPEDGF